MCSLLAKAYLVAFSICLLPGRRISRMKPSQHSASSSGGYENEQDQQHQQDREPDEEGEGGEDTLPLERVWKRWKKLAATLLIIIDTRGAWGRTGNWLQGYSGLRPRHIRDRRG